MDGFDLDFWDVLLLLSAGACAWLTLVTLMSRRRDRLVNHLRSQLAGRSGGSGRKPQKPAKPNDEPAAEEAA